MNNRFAIGDIVKHFKYETLTDDERKANKYIYRIEGFAKDTETEKEMVVYRALYEPFQLWVRSLEDFMGEVNITVYPNIKQKYRFELYNKANKAEYIKDLLSRCMDYVDNMPYLGDSNI